MKKLLLCLVVILTSMSAMADDSGKCGVNVTYVYTESNKTLTISGSGNMYNYWPTYSQAYRPESRPWYSYCSEILNVIIENGVTSIGENAFSGCSSFEVIDIPKSIEYLGDRAFSDCNNLKKVIIHDLKAWCHTPQSYPGARFFPEGAGHHLYLNNDEITDLVITDDITKISSYTFQECAFIKSISIGANTKEIGEGAFAGCSSLASITIGSNVESIGNCAFKGCTSLEKVHFNDSEKELRVGNNGTHQTFTYGLFYDCPLKKVYIGTTLRYYLPSPFEKKSALYEATFGTKVTMLEDDFFKGCSSLTTITIPKSVKYISTGAFSGCKSLKEIIIDDSKNPLFVSCGSSNNPLFAGCPIEAVYLGRTVEYSSDREIEKIENAPFRGCSHLKKLIISDSISHFTTIFEKCTSLDSISFPQSVISIGKRAFYHCKNLKAVNLGNNIKIISELAFADCSLNSVILPDSLKEIGDAAFYKNNLSAVTLPASLEKMGYYVFHSNYIKSVYSLNSVPPRMNLNNYGSFDYYSYDNAMLHVPSDGYDAYKTAGGWSLFKRIYKINDTSGLSVIPIVNDIRDKEDKYYNLQGQRVLNPKNGVYIKNGKKVIIK